MTCPTGLSTREAGWAHVVAFGNTTDQSCLFAQEARHSSFGMIAFDGLGLARSEGGSARSRWPALLLFEKISTTTF